MSKIRSRDGHTASIHYTTIVNAVGDEYPVYFAVPTELSREEFKPGFISREEAEYWIATKRKGSKAIYRLCVNRGDLYEYRYFIVSSTTDDDLYQGEFIPGFASREDAIAWWTNSNREFQKLPERRKK